MKHLIHLLFFCVGCGVGVWWGVEHPAQASNLAAQEQAAVSNAKVELLQRFTSTSRPDSQTASFKQMLSEEQQKLQDAKSKLGQ
jgi:hypothetical protein